MGDPFTLVTGIASLISLGLEVTKITREYIHGVRNATKDVSELLRELAALVDVLNQLHEFLKDDRAGKQNFDHTSVLLLTHSACEHKLKAVRMKLLKRIKDPKFVKTLTWPFIKKEHQQTVVVVHQWVQIFQFALTIDGCQLLSKNAASVTSVLRSQLQTLEETRKISQAVPALQQSTQEASAWLQAILESVKSYPSLREDIFNIKENVETLTRLALDDQIQRTQKTHDRGKQKLLEWISPFNVRPKQLDTLSRRSPSTGDWLLENKEFKAWILAKDPARIWCFGIPGAGKTVLTSIVIDHLQSNCSAYHTAIAYVYFDYKSKDTQNVGAVVLMILRQLIEQVKQTPQELVDSYESLPPDRKENNLQVDQCLSFIQTTCKDFDKVFLVFDALDECPVHGDSSNELRSKMISTIQKMSLYASIFVTSRPHVNLAQQIPNCLSLEVRATHSDMCAYLQARSADYKLLRRIVDQNPALEAHLVETICSKARGMYCSVSSLKTTRKLIGLRFLLARLQMDSLVNQTSARNVYRALDRLPEKLTDTFDDAMKRTAAQPEEHAILANQVISWIFYAKRPLHVAELREALSIEPTDTKLDRSGCHEVDLALDVCCGLVSIDEQDNVIRLVHYSLQQYLEQHWKIDCPGAKRGIAQTCLTYLTLDDFSPLATEDSDAAVKDGHNVSLSTRSRWQDSHRFFSYVASYWGEHVKGNLEKELEPLILRFFDKKVHLLYGLQEYNKLMYRSLEYDTWPYEPSPLHLTAYWGLSHMSKILINRGIEVNAQDTQKRTPLVCAALNGHIDVARVLLSTGADVDVRDLVASTPLLSAVINDHLEVTRLFLEHGANPNAQDKGGSTPMSLAASNGNLSMMRLLLEKGAISQKVGNCGLSPLEAASRGGHTAAVQWLLMRGAEVKSENTIPLVEAVYADQPQIVRILLDVGAKIDDINSFGYTALGAAVKKGNLKMAERLLAAGADVNRRGPGPTDETPLHMAVLGGNEALVSLLMIDHSAAVGSEEGEFGTVLQTAICSQHWNILKMVIKKSKNIDLIRHDCRVTPLQLAVLVKNIRILSLLLESFPEANPNITSSFGIAPLHQAVYLGWESGVDLLVKHGANPHLFDLYGQTCLDWALPDDALFRKLGGSRTYRETTPAEKLTRLSQSVRKLSSVLLANSDRRAGRRIDYHYLGHCLLRLGDISEARTSFEQQITNIFSKHEPTHNILCHQCGNDNIVGSRFVCHACADIDLCSLHMSRYSSEAPDYRCKRHRFLEVPGPKWKDFGNARVNERGETIEEWLARLLKEY